MAAVRDGWATWLLETRHGGDDAAFDEMLRHLGPIRDRVLDGAHVEVGATVTVDRWGVPSLAEAIDSVLDPAEAERFRSHLRGKAEAGDGVLRSTYAYLRAVK